MTKENKIFIGVLVVIVLGVGWLFVTRQNSLSVSGSDESVMVNLAVGSKAPAFSVTTIDGNTVSSETLRDKVVVVTSSAAWCSTCIFEAQQFAPVYAAHANDAIAFLTIDIDPNDSPEFIDEFRRNTNTPWDYADAASSRQFVQDYEIDRFEITYVIDKEGIIRFKDKEITATATLEQAIQPLL